jgi:acetoin utilization deacetylase AcuC-like enzyme
METNEAHEDEQHRSRRVGICRDALFGKHSNGYGHPESPERLAAIDRKLTSISFAEQLVELPLRDATEAELRRIHTAAHIRRIRSTREQPYTSLDPDTTANSDSWAAAVRAAGAAISAVDAVWHGECASAFALVRPPGHHAESGRAMGFCLFNNIAVAAAHALAQLGASRVLVVDWDVHHGNGTMHSFYETNEVLYASIHQFPHYPGTGRLTETGKGAGKGFTVNLPLPAGAGDGDYRCAFDELLVPIAEAYDPDLILVSAGFDGHESDPLAMMQLSTRAYADMTAALRTVADEVCDGRLVFALEGGYALDALADGVVAVLETCAADRAARAPRREPGGVFRSVIDEAVAVQRAFWRSALTRDALP